VLTAARWSEADAAVLDAIDRLLVPNTPAPRDRVRANIEPMALCGNQYGPSLVDGIWSALHELGTGVDEVLIALASDPKEPAALRASALTWLARFPSKAGLAFLQAALRRSDAEPELVAASASAYMAAFFGTRRPWERTARDFRDTFWSSHFDDVGAFARAFGPPRVADFLPELVRRLGDAHYEVRSVAARGLGFIDTPEAKAALRTAAQAEQDGGVLSAIHDSLRDAPSP
jgi:HEAT repeat protein